MGLSENNNTTNVLPSPRPYNSMHIVKSFLISQLCQSGYLTYHCMCHNYLMDLQHSHEIFLNKQEKRRKKGQYLQCTFIYPLQISDCRHCFANSKLCITPICNRLTTIFNSFEDMYNRVKDRYNRYEAIHNKNISTKDLKTGTIQCSHRSFKIGKTHRACKELTKRIHGEIKVF